MPSSPSATPAAPSTPPAASDASTKPWARRPDEENVWYDRFHTFLLLGPTRTIEDCYRIRKDREPKLKGARVPSYWRDMSVKWDWDDRAVAYDQHLRQRDLANEEDRRLAAREKRRALIDARLDDVNAALVKSELSKLSTEQAREALDALIRMLKDMLQAHRLEMGEPTAINQNQDIRFNADVLARAQRELGSQWAANRFGFAARNNEAKRMLVLVAPRNVDLVKLTANTLAFSDIEPTQAADLAGQMDAATQGENIGRLYLQVGLDTTDSAIYFAGDHAAPDSQPLRPFYGAHLLLLEAHTGDLGAWSGIAVDYIITLAPDLPAAEANAYTTALWTAIADEKEVEEAHAQALLACSEQSRARITRHW